MLKNLSVVLIILTIIVVNALRFWQLDNVPYGFNVDELSGAVTAACIETEGTDAHLTPHPVFFEQHYGTPKPPVYIYPGVIWTKTFGHKVPSIRAYTAFANVWTIVGLFFLARLILGTSYGLLVTLLASISPWVWPLSRIGYESTFCVTFFIWGIYFFLRSKQWMDKIAAAILFACAIYVYPPARLQTPIILGTLFIFDLTRQTLRKRYWAALLLTMVIICIPLVQGTLWGGLQQRFNDISIFNTSYLKSMGKTQNLNDLAQIFTNNYLLHFSPYYLFTTGDPSWEHSTQHFGLLSWLDILGILALIFFLLFRFKDIKPQGWWLVFLGVNFFIGIIPACLTNSGLPSSLRTIGSSPFLFLLAGYGLWLLTQRLKIFLPVIIVLSMIFAFASLKVYFTVYPQASKGWFGYWTKEEALNAKTDEDWLKFMVNYREQDYHFRYYLMNYRADSCSSSRARWIKMREMLGLPKAY
ncbi:MAG: glycosyltransferase family 39 protein [Candidatus Omnitrophica bacterium]|nr:glycosyltransferase family 39 protein [Candidatus Omnitrophota bacterium]